MKISLSWLKRHVDFSWSASELAERLTMRGFESEVATDFSTLDHVVVGQVISCQKHPDADKLSLCKVSDGSTEFDVICGAPNVATNQKIVFAKVGAILPGNFKIGKAKIRGIESHGMICSERELGISEEHEGILVLDDKAKVGTSIEKVLGPLFNAIEVEITPDKGFALSHRGIAREIAAMTNQSLKIPFSLQKPKQNASLEKISIDLDSKGGCTRYIGAVMKDVQVGPSPDWLKNYLKSVGQKSINNLVDISNFILLEIGQPTHIFDFSKFKKRTVAVQWAKEKEKYHALDEETYELSKNHLVITDSKETVALAGIIGGYDSAVTDMTTEVLIESAYFDPIVIRKGSKKLGLLSEASRRFERGIDPNSSMEALLIIIQLIEEVAGGKLSSQITDSCAVNLESKKLSLSEINLNSVIGQITSKKEITSLLKQLDFSPKETKDGWECLIPTYRHDIDQEADLVEEVLRSIGYENIQSDFTYQTTLVNTKDDEYSIFKLKNHLSSLGFSQCYNNSLQDISEVNAFGINPIEVLNPTSERMNTLRTTLHQGLLKNLDYNFKNGNADVQFYEYGTIFSKEGEGLSGINQQSSFSCLVHGNWQDNNVHFKSIPLSFYYLKGVLENINVHFMSTKLKFISNKHPYLDSYQDIVDSKGDSIASIGTVKSSFLRKLDIAHKHPVHLMDINLQTFNQYSNYAVKFQEIAPYPKVIRDLNFKLSSTVIIGDVVKAMQSTNQSILIDVKPVDIFKKSKQDNDQDVLFKLTFQSDKKTLEDNDVNPIINDVIKIISSKFKGILRDK